MFERIRFARYALKFERAFRSDDWTDVKACFHRDATYTVIGSGTEYDGVSRGRDAIAAMFKRMLDEADRRFDKRIPRLRGLPRVRDGELIMPWRVRYVLGEKDMWLTGEARCRWAGSEIIALQDAMVAEECRRWVAMIKDAPRSGTPR
jgi:hypothetical protein